MRRNSLANSLAALLVLLYFAARADAAPEDLDFFTNFEDIIPNTAPGDIIVLGVSPEIAEFGGDAFAGFLGMFQLYRSGARAWMVTPNGTGVIDFEPDAALVEFWATAHPGASGATVITAFDGLSVQVGDPVTINPGAGFRFVAFSGNIARIDVDNLDGTRMNGIDDFGFTPVPEPGATPMGLTAIAVLAFLRRHRARSDRRGWSFDR